MKEFSSGIIRLIVGKEIDTLGDDYFVITTISPYISSYQTSNLIKNIIKNVSGYNLNSIDSMRIDDRKCKIYNYSRKAEWDGWCTENVLLVELPIITDECIEDIVEREFINDFEIFDQPTFTGSDYDSTYNFVFLYQFVDAGDSIMHHESIYTELCATIVSILPNDTFIYDHKDDDVTPPDIRDSLSSTLEKYIIMKHGALVDKLSTKIGNEIMRMKKSHKRIFKNLFIIAIIIAAIYFVYSWVCSLNLDQNSVNAIMMIFAFLMVPLSIPQIRNPIINYIKSDGGHTPIKKVDEND